MLVQLKTISAGHEKYKDGEELRRAKKMNEELQIRLFNLVTLLEVCDTSKPLLVYDEDADEEIDVWDMIKGIAEVM